MSESSGRLVRQVWVDWAREQPDAKPSWLVPWEELDAGQREVDRRIEIAVATAERERIIAQLRRAAAGRREYAGPDDNGGKGRAILLQSAEHYESAVWLIEDPRNMLDVMPSWMWTDEENASLREQPPGAGPAEDVPF